MGVLSSYIFRISLLIFRCSFGSVGYKTTGRPLDHKSKTTPYSSPSRDICSWCCREVSSTTGSRGRGLSWVHTNIHGVRDTTVLCRGNWHPLVDRLGNLQRSEGNNEMVGRLRGTDRAKWQVHRFRSLHPESMPFVQSHSPDISIPTTLVFHIRVASLTHSASPPANYPEYLTINLEEIRQILVDLPWYDYKFLGRKSRKEVYGDTAR